MRLALHAHILIDRHRRGSVGTVPDEPQIGPVTAATRALRISGRPSESADLSGGIASDAAPDGRKSMRGTAATGALGISGRPSESDDRLSDMASDAAPDGRKSMRETAATRALGISGRPSESADLLSGIASDAAAGRAQTGGLATPAHALPAQDAGEHFRP